MHSTNEDRTVPSNDDLKSIATVELPSLYSQLDGREEGLSSPEAEERRELFGLNRIPRSIGLPLYKKLIVQFRNLFNVILLIAALLSFLTYILYDDFNSLRMGFAIIGVVVLSIFFNLYQEYRAEQAIKALIYLIPDNVKAIREGNLLQIKAEELVPGDILLLEAGDKVPADVRLITSHTFSVDNSILTGESEPQWRDALINTSQIENEVKDYKNLVLAGSYVTTGKGKGIVLATGKRTQIARVVEIINKADRDSSPIQKEVNYTAKITAITAFSVGIVFLIIALGVMNLQVIDSILFMIGVILSLVPEGLQVTITLSLALSAIALSKKKVLIKNLSTIHALGSTTVICTDKTGTLTQNQMMVEKIWINGKTFTVTGQGYEPKGEIFDGDNKIGSLIKYPELVKLGERALINSEATIIAPTDRYHSRYTAIGDTTDAATLVFAQKLGLSKERLNKQYQRVALLSFDHQRKMTTTIHRMYSKYHLIITKGSVDRILAKSTSILWEGKAQSFTPEMKQMVINTTDKFAKEGFRVIAFAERLTDQPVDLNHLYNIEESLLFLALIVLSDPPRSGVKEAVLQAKQAGIKVIMITGDYELTADAIARKVGLISPTAPPLLSIPSNPISLANSSKFTNGSPLLLTGPQLATLSNENLRSLLKSSDIVCARMNPEQKLRIVHLLKQNGEIVTVTGDGVNDVPALHEADVGVSMGLAGTQVAVEASQLVLLDDNFASIIKGVEGGRSILLNLKKYMKYVFTHNWAQLVGSIVFVIFHIPMPITVLIILLIDLIMEIPPSFALILEPPESTILKQPPVKERHLFNLSALFQSCYIGVLIGFFSLIQTMNAYQTGGWVFGMSIVPSAEAYSKGISLYMVGIMAGQLGNLFSCRTFKNSSFNRQFFHNKWVFIAIFVELNILFAIVYIPFLQIIFNTTALSFSEILRMFLLTPIILVVEEVRKFIAHKIFPVRRL